jgi:hypothetical protein
LDAKNSGIMIAWPMPIIRSRESTMPAIVTDRQQKKAAPSSTMTATPASFNGLKVRCTPSTNASTNTTTAWASARTPAANALPVTSAARGVGVTISLASTPASRSQMIWIP